MKLPKMDACIWTKNGGNILAKCLDRFNAVVPQAVIHRKIMIDDHSVDDTRSIGKMRRWEVYMNSGNGIADAANQALSMVSTDFFIALEQDILLAENWFSTVSNSIHADAKVASVQGIRYPSNSTLLAIYHDSDVEAHSIDNNIFRTELIREIGGFPKKCILCTDSWLKLNVEAAGYKWIIKPNVVSGHVRNGVRNELKHKYWQAKTCHCEIRRLSTHGELHNLLYSPASGVRLAVRFGSPIALFAYPTLQMLLFCAWLTNPTLRA